MLSIFSRIGHAAAVLALALILGGWPASSRTWAADNTDSAVMDQQKKIQRLKQGIDLQKSRMKTTGEQESSLISELDRLNRLIRKEGDKLAALKKELHDQEQRLVAIQEEIVLAREARDKATDHVRNRLHSLYKIGPVDVLNALFSTSALPDLLTTQEYFAHLLRYDQELVAQYRQKINTLESARLAREQEKKALLETLARITTQEKQLADSHRERTALLNRVKTEKKLYQQALKELETAADKLTRTLEKLKAEAETQHKKQLRQAGPKKRRPETAGFSAQKGRLSPPATGTVTTQFGRNTQGKFGITTFASGIDIRTRPGAEIKAVYDGTVVHAGVLRGYGNLLIIDHGQQYYSLVSRAAEFFKQEGDSVVKGEIIGVMSNEEGLLGEGLHFEIRRGTQPENPLLWLNNAGLIIKKASPRPAK